nr:hypothetical protein OG296_33655 [Streptomyces sp. NBC_01001]
MSTRRLGTPTGSAFWRGRHSAVFAADPALWHLVDKGINVSLSLGTISEGSAPLKRLSRLIDRQTASTVFKASDMDHC